MFSFKGVELSNDDKFFEKRIGPNDILISKIKITIVDTKCDSIEEIIAF